MSRTLSTALVVPISLALTQMGTAPDLSAQETKPLRVVSEQTVTGLAYAESVAYDPWANVLYVSQFGSELQPTLKDGKGRISKMSLKGEMIEERFLPAAGLTLNKPKGIWVEGNRLWVTDIDSAWIFDLKTRRGRKLALPGAQFANDPAVRGNVLFVSDNRGDQLYRVEPADFLDGTGDPKVTLAFSGKSINPNGLFPARDGSLLMVGFLSPEQARGIYALTAGGEIKRLSKDLGRLDGLFQMDDGTLLATDWNTGSLFQWSEKAGMQPLATGFKGPADFCVVPQPGNGATPAGRPGSTRLLVVAPDLVKGELRMIRLAR